MKTKTILILLAIICFFIVLGMIYLFYLPFSLKFQGHMKYFFSIFGPLVLFFVSLRSIKDILGVVKKRREVKKIIKRWYEDHPEKYKKSFFVGGNVFKSDFIIGKISPRNVFLETQAETELGLKWIDGCVNLVNKNYNLKELLNQ